MRGRFSGWLRGCAALAALFGLLREDRALAATFATRITASNVATHRAKGPDAHGGIGDWALGNGTVCAMVSDLGHESSLSTSGGVLIEENIIFGSPFGVELQFAGDNVIRKNEIFATGTHGIFLRQGLTSDNTIEFNNIFSNTGNGIEISNTAGTNNVIENNIILDNGGFDIDRNDMTADVTINNNLCETSNPGGLCPAIVPDFDIDHF